MAAVLAAPAGEGEYGFVTHPVDALTLTFEGIAGDRHAGRTREAGAREPWYPRGTEMRNERQISLLAPDELAEIARRLGVPEVKAEWIGANLVIDGLPHFSMLPASTRLFFEGGAVIVVDAQNAPCRLAGRAIAANYPERPEIEFSFAKVARRLRGLVGWVERPGVIVAGATVTAQIREQWIYRDEHAFSESRLRGPDERKPAGFLRRASNALTKCSKSLLSNDLVGGGTLKLLLRRIDLKFDVAVSVLLNIKAVEIQRDLLLANAEEAADIDQDRIDGAALVEHDIVDLADVLLALRRRRRRRAVRWR